MKYVATKLQGVIRMEPERIGDERGFFARTWDETDAAANGVTMHVVQCNVSANAKKHTLRGMHFQEEPYGEEKLVRVTRGAIYDVALDLRPASPTYLDWEAFELTAENGSALFIPQGCAHGFLTLEDSTEVFYQMGSYYRPDAARGVRYDDPAFRITWPAAPSVISEKDRAYPNWII